MWLIFDASSLNEESSENGLNFKCISAKGTNKSADDLIVNIGQEVPKETTLYVTSDVGLMIRMIENDSL